MRQSSSIFVIIDDKSKTTIKFFEDLICREWTPVPKCPIGFNDEISLIGSQKEEKIWDGRWSHFQQRADFGAVADGEMLQLGI